MFDPFDIFGTTTAAARMFDQTELMHLELSCWLYMTRLKLVEELRRNVGLPKDFRMMLKEMSTTLTTSIIEVTKKFGEVSSQVEIEQSGSLFETAKQVVRVWEGITDPSHVDSYEILANTPKLFTQRLDELRKAVGLKPPSSEAKEAKGKST